MRALVVYESVFGNTAEIARAVGTGLAQHVEVTIADVHGVRPAYAERFDLVVVGSPTRAFSLRPRGLPDAFLLGRGPCAEIGVRQWLRMLPEDGHSPCGQVMATFDTRLLETRWATGSAAERAANIARHLGYPVIGEPTSFYVEDVHGPLVRGERARAEAWGDALGPCRPW